jgi:flagellar operon protein
MDDTIINGVRVPFLPAGGAEALKKHSPIPILPEDSFDVILEKEIQEIRFSKHAQERLSARDIQLNDQDVRQISDAVHMADAKGAQESLVLLRDLAFIVNVKNRTVVTAMDGESLRNNVFTNIDSAVIAG